MKNAYHLTGFGGFLPPLPLDNTRKAIWLPTIAGVDIGARQSRSTPERQKFHISRKESLNAEDQWQ
ncbi:hypothetical protein JJJ17_06625 [Paracoccus caeni]|uniref:Uncharacterized protein n=1 Tax=Paracoccus caeni TaxID=657651 RepID=A0A934W097_9RHOB|nr:hypothetical protein [Paracoccus caeni]MBK4215594.1 hypothetical protein [Paracoccus caeni]